MLSLETSPATSRIKPSRAMNSPSLRLARRLDGSVGRPAPIREPPQLDFDFGSIFKRARGCTPIIRRRWARKHANREIEDVNFWLGGAGRGGVHTHYPPKVG